MRNQPKPALAQHRSVEEFIAALEPLPRAQALADYHKANLQRFDAAKGSGSKHQAWPGGYRHHLTQMLNMAYRISGDLFSLYGSHPFHWESVVLAVYFHDIEKTWKHVPDRLKIDPLPDKMHHLAHELPALGIQLTDEELNAVAYAHGEPEALYDKDRRIMGRLAGLVHAADVLSARTTFDLDLETTFAQAKEIAAEPGDKQ